jgi:hypothetical protein
MNKLVLGTLQILDRTDSVILIELDQFKDLLNLCEFSVDQKWILIYRASQDAFHAKCDNKPNTFIIIKSTNGNVFGGYIEQSWIHSGGYKPFLKFFKINKCNLFSTS